MTDTLVRTAFPASPPPAPYPVTDRQAEIVELADRLAVIAAENALAHDRDNSFPFDTYAALKESGYLALAVPEEFGGFGATPLEIMLGQQRLAWGDGSVALSSTMHHLQTAGVANNLQWPPELRERVLRDVVAARRADQQHRQRTGPRQPEPRWSLQNDRHPRGRPLGRSTAARPFPPCRPRSPGGSCC